MSFSRFRWSILVLVSWAVCGGGVCAVFQEKDAGQKEVDQKTVQEFEALGAYHYKAGNRQDLTMVAWGLYRQRGENNVLGFQFFKPPNAPLPRGSVPFGLDFSKCSLSDAHLKNLAHLENLRSLCLFQTHVSDVGLKHLSRLVDLTWLDLSQSGVTGLGFKDLAPLKKLTTLCLDKTQMTDANLRQLRELGLLHAVVLERTLRYSETNDRFRPKSAAEVRSFDLSGSFNVTDAGLKEIASFKKLIALNLSHTEIGDTGLRELADFADLESLDLTGTSVSDIGIKHLTVLKNLTHLRVAGTRVTEAGIKELAVLTKLSSLGLDRRQKSDAALQTLRQCKLLHLLSPQPSKSDEEVTELDLCDADITDAGLAELIGLQNLVSLNLRGTKVTSEGLRLATRFKRMANLQVDNKLLTDATLRILRESKMLYVLSNTRPGVFPSADYDKRPKSAEDVVSVDLSGAPLTDTGLKELHVFPNLRSLTLSETQISDVGLRELTAFKGLTDVALSRTAVTDAGLKALAAVPSPQSSEPA